MTRILVTGASGFIGRALVADLAAAGHSVRAAMRQPADVFPRPVEVVAVSDLTRPVEWRALLKGVETVVHLAGVTHAAPDVAEDVYDRVNRLATAELANAARSIGIKRLVFMSSIRAQCGPSSAQTLRETDAARPTDAYGRSKLAAEEAVRAAQVPFTILRPVLIYGPGVKGNLARLVESRSDALAPSHRSLPQPQIVAGAGQPHRRHPFRAADTRHQRRNLHRRGPRTPDLGRTCRCTACGPGTIATAPSHSACVDRGGHAGLGSCA